MSPARRWDSISKTVVFTGVYTKKKTRWLLFSSGSSINYRSKDSGGAKLNAVLQFSKH